MDLKTFILLDELIHTPPKELFTDYINDYYNELQYLSLDELTQLRNHFIEQEWYEEVIVLTTFIKEKA